jgi:hypothetical protein
MGEHLLEAEQPLLVRRSRLKRVIATALIIFKISSF